MTQIISALGKESTEQGLGVGTGLGGGVGGGYEPPPRQDLLFELWFKINLILTL